MSGLDIRLHKKEGDAKIRGDHADPNALFSFPLHPGSVHPTHLMQGLVVALSLLLPASARPEPAPTRPAAVAIQVAGDRCLDRSNVAAWVARWLGRDAVDARLTVRVTEGPLGASFSVTRDG